MGSKRTVCSRSSSILSVYDYLPFNQLSDSNTGRTRFRTRDRGPDVIPAHQPQPRGSTERCGFRTSLPEAPLAQRPRHSLTESANYIEICADPVRSPRSRLVYLTRAMLKSKHSPEQRGGHEGYGVPHSTKHLRRALQGSAASGHPFRVDLPATAQARSPAGRRKCCPLN